MNTDIGGNPTTEALKEAINSAQEVFHGYADCFVEGNPAKYERMVRQYAEMGFLVVKEKLNGDLRDFVQEEQIPYSWTRVPYGELYTVHYLAFLFPCHSIPIVLDEYFFDKIQDGDEKLKELGYGQVRKKTSKYSQIWGNENKMELLGSLRSTEIPEVSATDPRAYEILDTISLNLPEMIDSYNFAIFTPQKKRVKTGDPYEPVKIADFISPVKSVTEVPLLWSKKKLEELCTGLPLSRTVGLTSVVKTERGAKHIPMIDFKTGYIEEIYRVLSKIQMPRVIVESGNSYHFYGFELHGDRQWEDFLKKIKYESGVDYYWCEHQLEQGYSMLRLTPSRTKLFQPCLVGYYKAEKNKDDALPDRQERVPLAV